MLHDHEIVDKDEPEGINGAYLAKMCGEEWGIYKTFTVTLGNIDAALRDFELAPEDRDLVKKRIEDLRSRIENAPKSMGWKMRSKIGEKKQWYELPERDKEVVDSRIFGNTSETK